MNTQTLYINLPVKDLNKTRDFWTRLGCSFNEQFSDDKALCMVLREDLIYVMLVAHELFRTFTNRPIADASSTQVLTAIQVHSREEVDQLVALALDMGATRYRDGADHGWMYYDSFADLDGHQWEIMCINTTQLPQ